MTHRWISAVGMLAAVAALSMGLAVGDASASKKKAATTSSKSTSSTSTSSKESKSSDDSSVIQDGNSADLHWSFAIAKGKTIEIKGVNGDIRARRGSSDKVEVWAYKHAHHSDPDEVKIEINQEGGNVTVCAVYPGEGNDCVSGEGGHSHTHNNDVVVNFEVKIPPGVQFQGRTVNGEVEADDLGARVEARTVNGSIRISTSGYAEAGTVNGSITASMGSADWKEPLDFATVNGSITLDLPAATTAEVHAATENGDIESEFPMTVSGRISRHEVSGTIGKSGGQRLNLETVNGAIRLRKLSS
jgi:DUF4097 and DUF4098 domain-containing protein YvlB